MHRKSQLKWNIWPWTRGKATGEEGGGAEGGAQTVERFVVVYLSLGKVLKMLFTFRFGTLFSPSTSNFSFPLPSLTNGKTKENVSNCCLHSQWKTTPRPPCYTALLHKKFQFNFRVTFDYAVERAKKNKTKQWEKTIFCSGFCLWKAGKTITNEGERDGQGRAGVDPQWRPNKSLTHENANVASPAFISFPYSAHPLQLSALLLLLWFS